MTNNIYYGSRQYPFDNRNNNQDFSHDPERGKFSSRTEYLLSFVAQLIGLPAIITIPFVTKPLGGVFFWIFYLIFLFGLVIPLISMEATVGQFSSTAFLSNLRAVPEMKGLSYAMLIANMLEIIRSGSQKCVLLNQVFAGVIEKPFFNLPILMLLIYGLFIWTAITLTVSFGLQKFGKMLNASMGIAMGILVILFLRFGIHPGMKGWFEQFTISYSRFSAMQVFVEFVVAVTAAGFALGSGVGVFSTLASFADFREDPGKHSFAASLIVAGISFLSCFTMNGVIAHLVGKMQDTKTVFDTSEQEVFRNIGNIDSKYFWAIFLFIACFLIEFNKLAILVLVVTTALTDAYPRLRKFRRIIPAVICILAFLCSLVYMFGAFFLLSTVFYLGLFLRAALYFIENMTIVWGYGHSRFAKFVKDYEFMTQKKCKRWKFVIYKFVTPILTLFILVALAIYLIISYIGISQNLHEQDSGHRYIFVWAMIELFCWLIPIFIIPSYSIFYARSINRHGSWSPANPSLRDDYMGADECDGRNVMLQRLDDEQQNVPTTSSAMFRNDHRRNSNQSPIHSYAEAEINSK